MKKPLRLLFLTLGVGVVLFAAFVLAVNLYVQSVGMQTRIRKELSTAVGLPVTFFRATFSPWGGFRLDKLNISSDVPGSDHDFLRADSLEIRCALIPLLQSHTVLNRIILHSPNFVIQERSHPSGSTTSKKNRPSSPPADIIVILPEAIRPPIPPSPPSSPASVPQSASTSSPAPTLDIHKLQIRDANFRFLDDKGDEICRLESVRCTVETGKIPNAFSGKLEIQKIVLLDYLEINQLRSPVTLQQQRFHASKLHGEMAGGEFTGAVELDFSKKDLTYNSRFTVAKAQLDALFPPASLPAEELTGKVRASLNLAGSFARPDSHGRATLKISDGAVGRLPLLQLLGGIAGFNLGDLKIPLAETSAEIINSEIHIQPSLVTTAHLQIGFSGKMTDAQTLDLAARLILDDHLFKKMPKEARQNFIPTSDNKQELDFTINGPLSAPQSNLQSRLLGDQLPNVIRRLLGGKATPKNTKSPSKP